MPLSKLPNTTVARVTLQRPRRAVISLQLALWLICCHLSICHQQLLAETSPTAVAVNIQSKLIDQCCQVGRERAIESQKFNCKLGARDVFAGHHQPAGTRAQLLQLRSAAESLLARDASFADRCEMVLESCCLAHHRTRNCDSGKQFAKSGAACMDVELSKEATVATESFNDCCMSCSLGILAARNPGQNESTSGAATQSGLNQRCRLISPLASSLSGQLYEQTYIECCQENLPRISSTLLEPGAQIDCNQANACSQGCLQAGSLDPITSQRIESDRCDCFTGYRLASDGVTCVDIDECKLNTHTCNHNSEVCDNTRGSFRCLARSAVAAAHNHNHQFVPLTPSARALVFRDQAAAATGDQAAGAAVGDQHEAGEQPFASLRLCPLGSRWIAAENRCREQSATNSLVGPEQTTTSQSNNHRSSSQRFSFVSSSLSRRTA